MESHLTSSSAQRKVRFAPKGPPRRQAKNSVLQLKSEVAEAGDAVDEINEALLRKANEHLTRRKREAEKKPSVEVAFAHGVASPTSLKTYGKPTEGARARIVRMGSIDHTLASKQEIVDLPSVSISDDIVESSENPIHFSKEPKKKDYREPWDYHDSYYPITLPLRRPYSGDPELLDEEEFGENATHLEYDENVINSASDLGLLEECDENRMIFFQLPGNVHFGRQTSRPDGRVSSNFPRHPEVKDGPGSSNRGKQAGSSVAGGTVRSSIGNGNLERFPAGFLGKMLVYKSGAVKLKLGDMLYDVSPGSTCAFAQDVVAINTAEKYCCALGEISNRAIVTPDDDFLLD